MRMLLKVQIPVESGNEAILEGTIGDVIRDFMEKWKPEAAYFAPMDGVRTALFVLDVKDASQLPPLTESFYLELDASVEMYPCMNAQDLMKGLSELELSEEED